MKSLRHLGAAAVLTLTLTGSAWADGVMGTGATTPPPPPPAPSSTETISDEPTSDTLMVEPTIVDPTIETTLEIIQSILSIF